MSGSGLPTGTTTPRTLASFGAVRGATNRRVRSAIRKWRRHTRSGRDRSGSGTRKTGRPRSTSRAQRNPMLWSIDLDGHFGLNPALQSLKPLWDRQMLAIVEVTGSPDPTRSHFDAQDYMESGTPGLKRDGTAARAR